MSTLLNQTIVQFGRESRRDFNLSCEPLDWQPFDITFPQALPAASVRVFVTSNDLGVDSEPENNPIVGVVEDVTAQGFRLWGRNPSECTRSSAGFNWLALLETPGQESPLPVALRMGVVQPKFMFGRCAELPKVWDVTYGFRRRIGTSDRPPVVLATACNQNIWATTSEITSNGSPIHATQWSWKANAAMAAVVQLPCPSLVRLKATNTDSHWGNCAFYHVAVAPASPVGIVPVSTTATPVLVESGQVGAREFQPRDSTGDWRRWEISFDDPFSEPPIVLLTANELRDDGTPLDVRGPDAGRAAAAVGIAQNVTTHGFTLMARNSDCAGGAAGFYWAAFGCGRFCA